MSVLANRMMKIVDNVAESFSSKSLKEIGKILDVHWRSVYRLISQ